MQIAVRPGFSSSNRVGVPPARRILRSPRVLAAILASVIGALPALAGAATRYVADTGINRRLNQKQCGSTPALACRSITAAIGAAAPGDTILVGPGRYGDLNRNGVLGDIPGEEMGSPGCNCVLSIHKNVIVVSSEGAAVTMIDGASVNALQNVIITGVGGVFGRPDEGFTVTETARQHNGSGVGSGIVIDSANVSVRGNQVHSKFVVGGIVGQRVGIRTVNDAAIRIEGNQATGWRIGIESRGAAAVSKNQVSHNHTGIEATGGTVTGNVAMDNSVGISVLGSTRVEKNAAYANSTGFWVKELTSTVTNNNMFGNDCGLLAAAGFDATNNYWGRPSGPGPNFLSPPKYVPRGSDSMCGDGTTFPFATQPFEVRVLKP